MSSGEAAAMEDDVRRELSRDEPAAKNYNNNSTREVIILSSSHRILHFMTYEEKKNQADDK
jgi:hypothetical protein